MCAHANCMGAVSKGLRVQSFDSTSLFIALSDWVFADPTWLLKGGTVGVPVPLLANGPSLAVGVAVTLSVVIRAHWAIPVLWFGSMIMA